MDQLPSPQAPKLAKNGPSKERPLPCDLSCQVGRIETPVFKLSTLLLAYDEGERTAALQTAWLPLNVEGRRQAVGPRLGDCGSKSAVEPPGTTASFARFAAAFADRPFAVSTAVRGYGEKPLALRP